MNNNTFLKQELWGKVDDKDVFLFRLTNKKGMEVSVTNFGGIITSIKFPVKEKKIEMVLGFDTFEAYLSEEYRKEYPYFGAIIGRNAGRIKGGKTTLNGKEIQLSVNHAGAQLHGGFQGFDSKVWEVVSAKNEENPAVVLRYISPDGEEGFPGEVVVTVTYSLNDNNELRVDYHGKTNQPTIMNLTQHTYFNFNIDSKNILNHFLQVNGNRYSPLNPDYSPTGELLLVDNTHLDYRKPQLVHPDIDNAFPRQVSENEVVGSLICPESNIRMDVKTNQPVLHIYAGYYVPELHPKGRKSTGQNAGICFECQGFADALNYPQFPSTQLNPDEEYSYFATFRFSETK
ncbi:aldose epimerase family protein [Capnocytophaga catalasegens]|uniref:Aldose 1-epimerase n=1 Tax=Capnocytophaga catalasegens TaxID=1004260 RepID=A0AAV5AVU3_9FLAO|nr:aldose epimerase family protein [Capnocytophaga catalasegens]GIZ16233.1 aldose 1-epimerase [Capnocytophaga catalasegens]GJM49461.1 aldose 1-epimerase [Capnocytophaga catalasegens]GJM53633.1 aldose 1-epimerase [Capnocytophaga catalasegens]